MQKVSKSLLYFSLTEQLKQNLEEIIEKNSVAIDDFAKTSPSTRESVKQKHDSKNHKKKRSAQDGHDEIFNHFCWELENEAEMNSNSSIEESDFCGTPTKSKKTSSNSPSQYSIIEKKTFFEEKRSDLCSSNNRPYDDSDEDDNKENTSTHNSALTPINIPNAKQPNLSILSSAIKINKFSIEKSQQSKNSPFSNPLKKLSFLSNNNDFSPLLNNKNSPSSIFAANRGSLVMSPVTSKTPRSPLIIKINQKTLAYSPASGSTTTTPSTSTTPQCTPTRTRSDGEEMLKIQKKTTVKNASCLLIQEWHNNLVALENDTINLIEQLQDFISRTFLLNRDVERFDLLPSSKNAKQQKIKTLMNSATVDKMELIAFGFNEEEIEIMNNPQYTNYVDQIMDREFFEKKSALKSTDSLDVNNLFAHEKKMEQNNGMLSAKNKRKTERIDSIDYNIIDSAGERYKIDFKLRHKVYRIIYWIIKDLIRLITKKYSGLEDQEFLNIKKQLISKIEEDLVRIKEEHENCFASLIKEEKSAVAF